MLLVAEELERHGLAERRPRDQHRQLVRLLDGCPSNSTMTSPSLSRRVSAGPSVTTSATSAPLASVEPERLRDLGRDLLDHHAEPAARDLPLSVSCGTISFARFDRDGEADADVAAGAAEDRGVDADDLAAQVQQRATRVARIDGGVGLNEVVVGAGLMKRPSRSRCPTVTVCSRPNGLPIAMTHSPTRSVSESPSGSAGSPCRAFDLDEREVGLRVARRRPWP